MNHCFRVWFHFSLVLVGLLNILISLCTSMWFLKTFFDRKNSQKPYMVFMKHGTLGDLRYGIILYIDY